LEAEWMRAAAELQNAGSRSFPSARFPTAAVADDPDVTMEGFREGFGCPVIPGSWSCMSVRRP